MTLLASFSRPRCFRRVFLALAFLAAVLCPPRHAAAFGGVHQTKYAGVVQSIDYNNKTITFQPDAAGKTLSLGWNWDTSFFADKKRVKADALKAGTPVKVKFHSPLLGREFASKIEWESAPGR